MTSEERKIRVEVALGIVNDVYTDMCRAPTDEVSRERSYEFLCFIREMQKFVQTFDEEAKA